MKTVITLVIEHTKPLPDITDVICSRVWPYGGGCITDMTAAIQEATCEGCNGHGMVGGLRHDGYHSDVCPFCKGSGLAAASEAPSDMVMVSRDLLGAACSAIDKKRDAPTVLEKLRAITLATASTDTIRVGNETFSKERMREAIKAGRAQS